MTADELVRIGLIAAREYGAGINSRIRFAPRDARDVVVIVPRALPGRGDLVVAGKQIELVEDVVELKQWRDREGFTGWFGYSEKCDTLVIRT